MLSTSTTTPPRLVPVTYTAGEMCQTHWVPTTIVIVKWKILKHWELLFWQQIIPGIRTKIPGSTSAGIHAQRQTTPSSQWSRPSFLVGSNKCSEQQGWCLSFIPQPPLVLLYSVLIYDSHVMMPAISVSQRQTPRALSRTTTSPGFLIGQMNTSAIGWEVLGVL